MLCVNTGSGVSTPSAEAHLATSRLHVARRVKSSGQRLTLRERAAQARQRAPVSYAAALLAAAAAQKQQLIRQERACVERRAELLRARRSLGRHAAAARESGARRCAGAALPRPSAPVRTSTATQRGESFSYNLVYRQWDELPCLRLCRSHVKARLLAGAHRTPCSTRAACRALWAASRSRAGIHGRARVCSSSARGFLSSSACPRRGRGCPRRCAAGAAAQASRASRVAAPLRRQGAVEAATRLPRGVV